MIRIGRQFIIQFIYICLDLLCMVLCIYVASLFRGSTLPFEITLYNLFFNPLNAYRFIFLFWIFVTILLNKSYGLYQTKREIFETVEIWRVVKSVFMSTLITIVSFYVAKIPDFPRSILVLVAVSMIALFSLWRILKRVFVDYLVSQGYNNFNVLIVGAGKVGHTLVQEIRKKPALGLNVVGYLDDFKKNASHDPGLPVLGKISDFPKVARKEFINKIFIACHQDNQAFLQLLEQAKELGVAVRVVPQGFEFMTGEYCKYNIGIIPILEYCEGETVHKQIGKRLFDFITVLFLMILTLPLFLILAIMIKIDSSGPVLYLSRRYGRGGRIFNMYKFRSMCQDADKVLEQCRHQNEADGPIFKIKNDPRITEIGKFLRKHSLDELPQLFNVLKGDMSLVGPRPLPIDQIEKEDLRQLKRLEVKPGITGLWQIRGRSDISFARLVKWDTWYINNWSFWLDINILLQTIPVVLRGRGAY